MLAGQIETTGPRLRISMSTEEELLKVQKQLQSVKAEYEEYTYAVSHDLVASLRQIEGFSKLVHARHADQFDEKTKRHFDLIVSGAIKGREILEALLSYSRLSTAIKPSTEFACTQLIEETVTQLSSLIDKTDANVSYGDMPNIVGDFTQLQQLFYILIHNALHYRTPECSPIVLIDVQEDERQWQFNISDNGMGMSDHLIGKAFTILGRGVSDKEYTGVGMGLAIAKSIVSLHGGKIWVTSEKNKGSSFYFTLAKDIQR